MINKPACLLLLLGFLIACNPEEPAPEIRSGVSKELAIYRKKILHNIQYSLHLNIPAEKSTPISAEETIIFDLRLNKVPLQIDFKEDPEKISALVVNGDPVTVKYKEEHLLIDPDDLRKGKNEIHIRFRAGEGALNRNADYLYALFVPDRARTVFPCFDQPDLKAVYDLTLTIPANWTALANAPVAAVNRQSGRKTIRYQTSDTLSTYLFSFAAGVFESVKGVVANAEADFLYRETDTAKISRSVPEIFKIHTDALRYYEEWTGIAYPFQKFGFVAIPGFQFGGMEHPGAIQYKAASLFLDKGATQDQLNSRVNLIAHETAHMWFGDLVTMDWFSDVWMKEVFANLMADKSTEETTGKKMFDLKFLLNHYPAAYSVDRTKGANPIRQPLDNLKDAGTLYGNIIYHKAPIMMRQLERLMGKEKFQQGVREYLTAFSNKNASWPDLIRILDKYTEQDLNTWNKVWVNEAGRPVITYKLEQKDKKIERLLITQTPEWGEERIWPQLFEIALVYPDRTRELTVNMNAPQVELKEAAGQDMPLFVLFNSTAQGYGLWPADKAMPEHLSLLTDPLHRALAYITLYENMLNGRSVSPRSLLEIFTRQLGKEKEELNCKLLTGYIQTIFWQFTAPALRDSTVHNLEHSLWQVMEHQSSPNMKKLLFKAYQGIFLSSEARSRLYGIWKKETPPGGVTLTEDDYTALSFSLAVRGSSDPAMLITQRARISNPDRQKRFEFILPAVSADVKERDAFFTSLQQPANRQKESNVLAALSYLHHPLRQPTSVKYLPKTLEMLEEIQRTGDIFFPYSWLSVSFGNYQSKEAMNAVEAFLNSHPDYNPGLKAKILQATDDLSRADKLGF